MPTSTEAEENLRVIRSLMEKATIYRAISAEAAAVGGILAIAGSFSTGNWLKRSVPLDPADLDPTAALFLGVWLALLGLTSAANLFFLRRAAAQRGEPFVSAGMRLAAGALLPSCLVAGVMTVYFARLGSEAVLIVPIWITCYGLALLAAKHFAPRSLVWLGWAFLLAGLVSFVPMFGTVYRVHSGVSLTAPWHTAQMLMAATFGLFHLIYAACAWPRKTGSGA